MREKKQLNVLNELIRSIIREQSKFTTLIEGGQTEGRQWK